MPSSQLLPVTAPDSATGVVEWRAKTVGPVSELSVGDGLITVGTSGTYRLTLLNPGGRVIWSVPEYVANDMTWADTSSDFPPP